MSDAMIVPSANAPVTEDPYETRTITYNGHEYTFSFYKGFASTVTFTPPGGDPIQVYKQVGVFNCQDTGGPLPNSTFTITGGPQKLDIELDIEDGPLLPPDYRGPIQSIQVGMRGVRGKPVTPGNQRVKPVKGADQIATLSVKERVKLDNGGVFGFQASGGGTVTVDNDAATCPPTCKR